jgi:hypothetical protein
MGHEVRSKWNDWQRRNEQDAMEVREGGDK